MHQRRCQHTRQRRPRDHQEFATAHVITLATGRQSTNLLLAIWTRWSRWFHSAPRRGGLVEDQQVGGTDVLVISQVEQVGDGTGIYGGQQRQQVGGRPPPSGLGAVTRP